MDNDIKNKVLLAIPTKLLQNYYFNHYTLSNINNGIQVNVQKTDGWNPFPDNELSLCYTISEIRHELDSRSDNNKLTEFFE